MMTEYLKHEGEDYRLQQLSATRVDQAMECWNLTEMISRFVYRVS